METKHLLHTRLHSTAAGGSSMLFMYNTPNVLSSKCKTPKKVTLELTPGNPTGAFSRETQYYLPHLTRCLPAETGMNFLLFKKSREDLKAKGFLFIHRQCKAQGEPPPPVGVRITLAVCSCPQQL